MIPDLDDGEPEITDEAQRNEMLRLLEAGCYLVDRKGVLNWMVDGQMHPTNEEPNAVILQQLVVEGRVRFDKFVFGDEIVFRYRLVRAA